MGPNWLRTINRFRSFGQGINSILGMKPKLIQWGPEEASAWVLRKEEAPFWKARKKGLAGAVPTCLGRETIPADIAEM